MQNVHIAHAGAALDFQSASLIAKDEARKYHMKDPTIVSWHQHPSPEGALPYYDGADPDTWWEKYGTGNGGKLEISVGDDFQFIMLDAGGFEKLGEMPLRNLSDGQGNQFLCFTPMLGRASDKPTDEACTQLDGWAADQF